MEEQNQATLQNAQLLIQVEKKKEAQLLLLAFLKRNPQSAPAWWVLSQAVEDARQELDCLERVLQLDPEHPQARLRLAELKGNPDSAPQPAASQEPGQSVPQADNPPGVFYPTSYETEPPTDQFDLFTPGSFDRYNRDVDPSHFSTKQDRTAPPLPVKEVPQAQGSGAAVQASSEIPAWIIPPEPGTPGKKKSGKHPARKERMSVLEIILLIILIFLILAVVGYFGLSQLGII